MKRTFESSILTAAIFLILLIPNNGFSQSRLIVQLNAGYLLPLPDFRGTIPPGAGDNDYQMNSGFLFGAAGKYALDKNNMLRLTASLTYNMCSNNGDIEGFENSLETHKINIFSFGAGTEFAYTSKNITVPFLGVEFTANSFNGKNEYEIGDTLNYITKLKSEWRFGILVNGGVDIRLEKDMGIVLGVKYNIANLLGKNNSTSATEITLNDKEYTDNGVQVDAKNIRFLQLYAGLSIYMFQPQKKRKN